MTIATKTRAKPHTETITIRNRWSWRPEITVEITCDPSMTVGVKLGLAVRKLYETPGADLTDADLTGADLRRAVLTGADLRRAVLRRAVLTGADLTGADLTGADLRRAVLTGADLTGADLTGADLTGADLRSFKADLWMTLTQARAEVPALISALRDGRVNGSTYSGDCACLVGTLVNAHVGNGNFLADRSVDHPAEQWFLMIRTGDKPGDNTGGGFAAQKALEWVIEYCALTGIEVPDPTSERDRVGERA